MAIEVDGDDAAGIAIDILDEVAHVLGKLLSDIAVVGAVDGKGTSLSGKGP